MSFSRCVNNSYGKSTKRHSARRIGSVFSHARKTHEEWSLFDGKQGGLTQIIRRSGFDKDLSLVMKVAIDRGIEQKSDFNELTIQRLN